MALAITRLIKIRTDNVPEIQAVTLYPFYARSTDNTLRRFQHVLGFEAVTVFVLDLRRRILYAYGVWYLDLFDSSQY